MALLNAYFDVVVDRVAAHGGTLHKFMGDAALCVWGAPRELPDPERSAVSCALAIQRGAALVRKNARCGACPGSSWGLESTPERLLQETSELPSGSNTRSLETQ
jgi:hypothetical protein